MSVTNVCETPDSPSASISADKVSYTRKFLVTTSDRANDGPITVANGNGIPAIGTAYTFGNNEVSTTAFAKSYDAERLAPNSYEWIVTVSYESDDNENKDNNDPTLEAPTVKVGGETRQVPLQKAWAKDKNNGQWQEYAMANSAGDQFDPLPAGQEYILTLTISRNEPFNPAFVAVVREYSGAVAEDAVFGLQGAIMRGIDFEPSFRMIKLGAGFVVVRYLKVNYNLWFPPDLRVLDIGPYHLVEPQSLTEEKTKKQFVTVEGQPRLGLLDGKGHALNGTGSDQDPPKAKPVFLGPYKPNRPKKFAPLRLPTSLAQVQCQIEFGR